MRSGTPTVRARSLTQLSSSRFNSPPFFPVVPDHGSSLTRLPRREQFSDRFADVDATRSGSGSSIDRDLDGQPDLLIADPAFDVKELKTNVVVRWEMQPGSSMFLVWSQGRNGSAGDTNREDDLWTDARDLFRLPATNVLLLKVSTWVGW